MRMNFNEAEVRVLGSLMEKELTTPENYPLSVNALTNACNQKSNRDPVFSMSESEVLSTLESLGNKGMARLTATGGRVAKYRHSVAEKLRLDPPGCAVLAELMLRGPQTAAELRGRAERMAPIPDVEEVLDVLKRHAPPLVALLPRQAGRKEQRYAQLLAGMPELPEVEEAPERESVVREPLRQGKNGRQERLDRISEEVAMLRSEMAVLRQAVEELVALFQ